jgi:hypothetical protein
MDPQPVRRKSDADATGTNQLDVTGIFCGKLLSCPDATFTRRRYRLKSGEIRGFPPYPQSSGIAAWPGCGVAETANPSAAAGFVRRKSEMRAKTKDPSGGTTGRVKPYGRLGGWALAPNTASMGRDNHSHLSWSQKGRHTFKSPSDFLSFFGSNFGRKLLRGGAVGFVCGRPFGRHSAGGLVQRPDPGNVLPVRSIFGSTGSETRRPPSLARNGRERRGNIRLSCAKLYGAATARLTIFSLCSLRIRLAISSFDIALLPNCSRNMPPVPPSTIEA